MTKFMSSVQVTLADKDRADNVVVDAEEEKKNDPATSVEDGPDLGAGPEALEPSSAATSTASTISMSSGSTSKSREDFEGSARNDPKATHAYMHRHRLSNYIEMFWCTCSRHTHT